MSFSDQLKCGRCAAAFPEVHIVKCDRVTAGGLVLCYVCHKRLHPRCTMDISVIHPSDRLCNRCLKDEAVIVCPQCSVKDAISTMQLCRKCSDEVHVDIAEVHLDHVTTMP